MHLEKRWVGGCFSDLKDCSQALNKLEVRFNKKSSKILSFQKTVDCKNKDKVVAEDFLKMFHTFMTNNV